MTKQRSAWAQERFEREQRRKACPVHFTEEDWYTFETGDEEFVVPLIKLYLRTPGQTSGFFTFDITIEDALNGRVVGEEAQAFVRSTFEEWNKKLGYKHFG